MTGDEQSDPPPGSGPPHAGDAAADVVPGRAERRWLPSLAVLVLIVLPFFLPDRFSTGPRWILPILEGSLLIAIIVADPGRIDRRSALLRNLGIALTVLLVAAAVWATVRLVHDLLQGAPSMRNASTLLLTGGLVWLDANITFSLLYWQLDGGGSAERLAGLRPHPDLAFPEQLNPDLAPPGWRPTYIDYLYLGLTNALAFSPTDVMPLAHWAKLTMAAQSILSILILSLVIANAVNILG